MKILMLVSALNVANGVASFAMEYLRNVDHEKYHIDFAVYNDIPNPYYDEIEKAGSECFILPSITGNPVKHSEFCRQLIKSGNYDVVHANTLLITWPMMFWAKFYNVSVRILHSHGSTLGESKKSQIRNRILFPLFLTNVNKLVACSEYAGKCVFGKKKFSVLPNVIDVSKFAFNESYREKLRKEYNSEDKLIIGSVARLVEIKNPFFAVDVFEKVLEKIPNAEYWWIGDGPLEEEMKGYISGKNLEGKFRLLGRKDNANEFYSAFDCMLMPSFNEGLPITCVEAQSSGLPCFLSDSITDEVDRTGLVHFISLNENAEKWSEDIVSIIPGEKERSEYSDKLSLSDYSDKNTQLNFDKLYLNQSICS